MKMYLLGLATLPAMMLASIAIGGVYFILSNAIRDFIGLASGGLLKPGYSRWHLAYAMPWVFAHCVGEHAVAWWKGYELRIRKA